MFVKPGLSDSHYLYAVFLDEVWSFRDFVGKWAGRSLWRNRLARSAVNRKVGGSSPPRDDPFKTPGRSTHCTQRRKKSLTFFPTSRKGKLLGLTTSPLTCFGSAQRELQKVSLLFSTKVSLLQHFRLNGKWHSWFQYSRRAISATPATIDLFHYCRCSVRS